MSQSVEWCAHFYKDIFFWLFDTEPKTYIALGNYLAESDEVMSLREGEQVTILDDGHGEWWMARRETTGEEGWVPKGYLATAEQYDEHLRSQLEEVVKEMSIDGKGEIVMWS